MPISVKAMRHWLSFACAAAVTLACAYFRPYDGLAPADLRSAAGVVAQISATMLGFMIAALSILATITHTVLLQNMQKTGHFLVLLRRMYLAAVSYGITMLAAMAGVISSEIAGWAVWLVTFLVTWSSALLVDFGYRFWMVLTHLRPGS